MANDYGTLSDEIQRRIEARHARAKESGDVRANVASVDARELRMEETRTTAVATATAVAAPTAPRAEREGDAGRAFAVVDEIMDDSPAARDGLVVFDRVCTVGDVRWGFEDPSATPPSDLLTRAATTFQENVNSPVRVLVRRRGVLVELNITPRAWSGRGVLGCHFASV